MRYYRCYCFLAAQLDEKGLVIHTDICAKRRAENEQMQREECIDEGHADPDDGETCKACCDHEFDSEEGFMCLNCGTEGFEEVMSNAYDRMKDGE